MISSGVAPIGTVMDVRLGREIDTRTMGADGRGSEMEGELPILVLGLSTASDCVDQVFR